MLLHIFFLGVISFQMPDTPPESVCGNGIVEPQEYCDDGNQADGDSCPANCKMKVEGPTDNSYAIQCGDGKVDITEQCDDGNVQAGDGCSASCHWEFGLSNSVSVQNLPLKTPTLSQDSPEPNSPGVEGPGPSAVPNPSNPSSPNAAEPSAAGPTQSSGSSGCGLAGSAGGSGALWLSGGLLLMGWKRRPQRFF